MNRATRDPVTGRRYPAAGSSFLLLRQQQQQQQQLLQRRVSGVAAGVARGEGGDDGLDLFSKNRRSVSISAGEESDGQNAPPNLGRISVGSAKLVSGMDDLLSAADMGKHDYDWLLTPPGSPLSLLDTRVSHLSVVTPIPMNDTSAKPVSTARTSRFSMPQVENNNPVRPVRSSSVTRPSISTSFCHVSSNSNRTSVLNTSTASVTSSRPSTPTKASITSSRPSTPTKNSITSSRSSTPTKSSSTSSRPSTPTKSSITSSRPSAPSNRRQSAMTQSCPTSRSSTPAKTRSTPSSSSHSSRPSTPTSRSQNCATSISNSSSTIGRSSSRPSTPTRRAPAQASAQVATRFPSVGQNLTINTRNPGPASRPGSPGPRVSSASQPFVLPDFPLDVPSNLRTKIPERPASAGRTRPGLPLTVRTNLNAEAAPPTNLNGRRSSSPIVTRCRGPDNPPRLRLQSNGHEATPPEMQKPALHDGAVRKSIKPTSPSGFGRTISKMSLDMALRHMDIRQGMGGNRGASLYPQSIRSTTPKVRPARMCDTRGRASGNETDTEDSSCDGMASCNGGASENGDGEVRSPEIATFAVRASAPDICESSRYDAILLREDSKNLNWLHSIDDKSDQSSVFDHSFEPLPEPFLL